MVSGEDPIEWRFDGALCAQQPGALSRPVAGMPLALHQMEANYHEPEPFRYSLNSFIRAVKEVPLKLQNDLQRHPEVRVRIKTLQDTIFANDLFNMLGKQRDFIVHHGALNLKSRGQIGTTEGSKIKLSFPFAVHPWETSVEAYERYKEMC